MNTSTSSPERSPGPSIAGNASVVCLASILVVMSAGSATLSVLMAKQAGVQCAVDVEQAFMTAEAATSVAMRELQLGVDDEADGVGVVSGAVGRAVFATTIAPPFAGSGTYTITATGRIGRVTRSIDTVVQQRRDAVGFSALGNISMSGGLIDTYESDLGTYASQVSGTHAGNNSKLETNGSISLSGSAQIWGDAIPGPTGTVSGAIGVHGSTAPAAAPITMPTYTYSPPIASAGALSTTTTFNAGTYRYSTFTIGGGKIATFIGDVVLYVDGNFTISGSGVGIVTPGAHVTIHHGSGTFTISGSGMVNQDQRPSNLDINSATTSAITVSGSAAFYGCMLAPRAPLTASGGAGIYGSAKVNTMTLTGGMCLHADKSLGAAGAWEVRLTHAKGNVARRS